MRSIFAVFALLVGAVGCTLQPAPAPPGWDGAGGGDGGSGSCRLTSRTTNVDGSSPIWTFLYDPDGVVTTITRYEGGAANWTNSIDPDGVAQMTDYGTLLVIRYDADILAGGLPTAAEVSLTIDGVRQDGGTYLFAYDADGRLIEVEQHFPIAPSDHYDLLITYDDDDNVRQLESSWSEGFSDEVTTVTVEAYDDHPTPYEGIPAWRFLANDFLWSNADPGPILTALSRHNPLDYTNEHPAGGLIDPPYRRDMAYAYNSDGYPTERQNVDSFLNATGTSSSIETYSYICD